MCTKRCDFFIIIIIILSLLIPDEAKKGFLILFHEKITNKTADLELTSQLQVNRLSLDANAHHLMARLTGFYAVFMSLFNRFALAEKDKIACLSRWFCNTVPFRLFGVNDEANVNPAEGFSKPHIKPYKSIRVKGQLCSRVMRPFAASLGSVETHLHELSTM